MHVTIKTIPEHIAYTAEYDVTDYNDFFDEATGANQLADLEETMRAENPGVEVPAATAFHEGPYEEVGRTYDMLYRWIEENGFRIAGPGRSSALHGPWDRENKNEYLMEIQIPVEKA